MNWIRITTDIHDDPRIGHMTDALDTRLSDVVGCVVGLLGKLPAHARDGCIAHIPDRNLEQWAHWEGERGAFAREFRAHLCSETGVVRAWEKHNGGAIREADRKRKARETAASADDASEMTETGAPPADRVPDVRAEPARNGRGNSETRRGHGAESARLRDGTGRDVTELALGEIPEQQQQGTRAAAPRRPGVRAARTTPKYPGFPQAVCADAVAVWQTEVGDASHERIRAAFGSLFAVPEAERPPGAPRDAELVPAIRLYLGAIHGTRAAQFVSPQNCAKHFAQIVAALRAGRTTEEQLDRAIFALGLTDEVRRLQRAPA